MRRGPEYTLDDGLRLWDHDTGCGRCGKRAAEVLHDPSGRWNAGTLVCLDCGTATPVYTPEHRTRIVTTRDHRSLPLCSCRRLWAIPTTRDKAQQRAEQHLREQGAA